MMVLAAVLAILGLPAVAEFYTDWLWFGEVGFVQVFLTSLAVRTGLGAGVGVLAFLLLWGNWRLALRHFSEPYLVLGVSPADGAPVVLQRRGVSTIVNAASALGAGAAGVVASGAWMTWLQFRHATAFGTRDPIFGRDVSFYVLELPALTFARNLLLTLCVAALVGSALIYLLPGRTTAGSRLGPLRPSRRHLSVLAAAVFLLLAAGAYLDTALLLLSPAGIIQGATYVDVNVGLPALRLLAGAALVASALSVAHALSRRSWPMIAAVGVVPAGGVGKSGRAAGGAAPRSCSGRHYLPKGHLG
jgi:uncharacterized membrane protein (UPF0182 family)